MGFPDSQAWLLQAVRLHQLGRLNEAKALYVRLLAWQPDQADAWHFLGALVQQGGRSELAVALIGRAITLEGERAVYHSNLGVILDEMGRSVEALDSFDAVVRLKPESAEGHSSRGTVLNDLGQSGRALVSTGTAISLQPGYAQCYFNRAAVLARLGRVDEAIVCFGAAIRLEPNYAEAHHRRSLLRLLMGDFAAGWAEHEWRRQGAFSRTLLRDTLWRGEDLAGRTILLHGEQGFGDTLQFCRYVPLVAARGGRVIVRAPRPLLSLLTSLEGVAQGVAEGDPAPPFDLHSPLMSLPWLFGTRADSIPAKIPYLRAGEAVRARWAERLGEEGKPRIGLVWAGSPAHGNDRNRSMPFADLAPLWGIAGVRWYSLQVGERRSDLAGAPAGLIEDLSPHLGDFNETAAALSQLDLLLTVDTSTAHLAGACGCAAWVMLPHVPDWRWFEDRADSPWYPSLRLFRQAEPGDWGNVVADVARALVEQ